MKINDTGIAVDDLVDAIKNAIKLANISGINSDRDLRVIEIELTLNAVASRTAGGRLDLRVPFVGMRLQVGGSVTRRDTHKIGLALVPPDLQERYEVRDVQVETVLVDAVETIREIMTRAAEGDDPFLLKTGTVDLSFAVTRDGSIILGFDGELKDEVTHTLRLSLGVPQPSPSEAPVANHASSADLSQY
jgi:Trypsin-co-occurring domain 2